MTRAATTASRATLAPEGLTVNGQPFPFHITRDVVTETTFDGFTILRIGLIVDGPVVVATMPMHRVPARVDPESLSEWCGLCKECCPSEGLPPEKPCGWVHKCAFCEAKR